MISPYTLMNAFQSSPYRNGILMSNISIRQDARSSPWGVCRCAAQDILLATVITYVYSVSFKTSIGVPVIVLIMSLRPDFLPWNPINNHRNRSLLAKYPGVSGLLRTIGTALELPFREPGRRGTWMLSALLIPHVSIYTNSIPCFCASLQDWMFFW